MARQNLTRIVVFIFAALLAPIAYADAENVPVQSWNGTGDNNGVGGDISGFENSNSSSASEIPDPCNGGDYGLCITYSSPNSFGGSGPGPSGAANRESNLLPVRMPETADVNQDGILRTPDCPTPHPVILDSGNKVFQETDFMAGGQSPFGLVRSYHKNSAQSGVFGPNWFSSFDYKLGWVKNDTAEHYDETPVFGKPGGNSVSRAPGKDGTMYLLMPDGSLITLGSEQYYPSPSGDYYYKPNSSALLTLKWTAATGVYTLTDEDNNVITFGASGEVLSGVDQYGVGWTVINSPLYEPVSVTHSSGKTIKFTWNANNQVTGVTDPAGTQYTYTYNGTGSTAMLTSETRPGSPSTTVSYLYEDANNPNGVTGKVVNGVRYGTYSYVQPGGTAGSVGRVSSSGLVGGVDTLNFSYGYEQINGQPGGSYTTVTNSQGAVATYHYNNLGNGKPKLISMTQTGITNCPNTSRTITYDSYYHVTTEVDNNGNETDYNYNAAGQLTQVVSGINPNNTGHERIANYTWDTTNNRLTSVVTQVNKAAPVSISETDYAYYPAGNAAAGRLQSVTMVNRGANGSPNQQVVTSYTYTVQANKLLSQMEVTNSAYGSAGKIDYNYDSAGNLTSVVNGLGQTVSYSSYNSLGLPQSVTDANGLATTFTYDTGGRVTQTQQVVGGVTRTYGYAYNGFNKPTSITYPTGRVETYTYDAADRLSTVASNQVNSYTANGGTVNETYTRNYSYNSLSKVSEVWLVATDSGAKTGSTTYYSRLYDYDSLGRLTGVRGNHSQHIQYTYDSNNNVLTITDALNRITTNTYDAFNELATSRDPNGKTTTFSYDGAGHLASVTDPRGLVTSYLYDGLGNKVQQASPDTGTTSYVYANGINLSKLTRADGSTVNFSVDALGRVYQVGAGTLTNTYTFDTCTNGKGRLCKVTDASGSTTYTYTASGVPATQASVIGTTTYNLGWSYDVLDRITSISYPDGSQVNYQYGTYASNVSTVSAVFGGVSHTVVSGAWFLDGGPLGGLSYGNGLAESRTYDTDLRLSSKTTGSVQNLGYSYDAANQLNQLNNNLATANSQSLGYDPVSRLGTVSSSGLGNQSIVYDASGNRTSATWGGITDTYTPSSTTNQISSIAGSRARNFSYDVLGNLKTATGWNGNRSYGYDALNHLNSVTNAGVVTGYAYNGLGQRVQKSGSAAFSYVYALGGALLGETSNGGTTITTDYVWLGTALVGLIRGGTLYYVHDDHLNRPDTATSSAGAIVWQAQNTAFDRTVTTNSIGGLNIGFPGQYYDAESGLYYNGARYYDPTVSRYLQSDPIGLAGGLNPYAYALGNPVALSDPTGTDAIITPIIGAVIGGYAGYINGGISGAVIGTVVGAGAGVLSPALSAAAAEAAVAATGVEGTSALVSATVTVAYAGITGAVGAFANNIWTGHSFGDDVAFSAAAGAIAPLASGEALAASGLMELGVVGENAFSSMTGLMNILASYLDPNSAHGFSAGSSGCGQH